MDVAGKARFATIVAPHFDALYRTALRLTREPADAEDLVQDVCLRAIGHLTDLSGADDPKAWLLRVQFRLFVDARRRRLRSPVVAADDAVRDAIPDAEPAPDELVDAIASHDRLARAWGRLRREQQALLALNAEGYDLDEISRITGVARGALSARLYRARLRLAKALSAGPPIALTVGRLEN